MRWDIQAAWLVALFSGLIYLALELRGIEEILHLPLLMFAVGALTVAQGWRLGFVIAGIGILAELVFDGTLVGMWTGIVLVAGVLVANQVSHRLRVALTEQQEAKQKLGLLVGALDHLTSLNDRSALLKTLPKLLESRENQVEVWIPQGSGFVAASLLGQTGQTQLPGTGVVGRAFRERVIQYVPDVQQDPGYIRFNRGLSTSELALPLLEQEDAVAVLNIERSKPFEVWERAEYERFVGIVNRRLSRLAERAELEVLSELARSLPMAQSAKEVAERALAVLVSYLGVRSGGLLMQMGSVLKPLALLGEFSPEEQGLLQAGIAYNTGISWEVYRSNTAFFANDYQEYSWAVPTLLKAGVRSVVRHPVRIGKSHQTRAILGLEDTKTRPWLHSERALLDSVCRTIGLALDATFRDERIETLLQLQRDLIEADPEAVYREVLKVAIRLVHGAEAGSLLVRDGEWFRFKAAEPYDLQTLSRLSYSVTDQHRWYGQDIAAWQRGEPRIFRHQQLPEPQDGAVEIMNAAGLIQQIQTNLSLPIVYRGEVLAMLDLDNLHDPDAFAQDSLDIARLFAPAIAALLHESRQRKLLDEAAHSDSLTGLGNRRAFDRALAEGLARAQRYSHPLSLALMDLRGFKKINDTLGHAKGDLALTRVAQALRAEQRGADSFYRWGGDEFAVLLPHTSAEGAQIAVKRFSQAIANIHIENLPLGVNVGMASYPVEAQTSEDLLRLADERMYQDKHSDVSLPADSR